MFTFWIIFSFWCFFFSPLYINCWFDFELSCINNFFKCVFELSVQQVAMGLCKCPKRKVTNLFCFEHRVNVCEHCLVSNHNKVSVIKCIHSLKIFNRSQFFLQSKIIQNCLLTNAECPIWNHSLHY